MNIDDLNFGIGRRLPLVLQCESAECGLASLAMIAGYYGFDTDLRTLRTDFPISLKGATLGSLMKCAASIGLNTRPVRLELHELKGMVLPCILHWDLNHFVVLKRVSAKNVEIHDPARGRREVSFDELSKHFTGVGLELEPGLQFRAVERRESLAFGQLFGQLFGLKRSIVQILVLAFSLEIFGIIAPLFSQWIIDDALVSNDVDLVTVLVAGVVAVGILRVFIGLIRSWVILHLTTTMSVQWSANVFAHLLRLPVSWFESRHLGDVVSRFGSTSTIQQAITGGVVSAIVDGLMAILTAVVMFLYSPALSVVVLFAVVGYAGIRYFRYSTLRDMSAEQLVLGAKLQSYFLESVRGVQTLKLFNREEDRRQRYVSHAVDVANNGIGIQKQNFVFSTTNGLLVLAENAAVLFIASQYVLAAQFSIGMLIAFITYKDQFVSRITSLIDQLISFRMLSVHADRLGDIVLTAPENVGRNTSQMEVPIKPSVSARGLGFRYSPGDPWVLRNVNFDISEGESVAIAGPSGCGKTTLLKILLGQLVPEEGEVLIGGVPLNKMSLAQYRDMMGVVLQEDHLFAGSIAENICCFDLEPDLTRIEATARLAAIHSEILAMPMGYSTLIGDMGSALSGGQKQRVVLARALYKKPKLLLLDEATSHLDTGAETQINTALRRLKMTRVMIAHRPQTLAAADRLIILPIAKELVAA